MKTSEIRELNQAELELKIKELKEELFNLRFQYTIRQLDNPMQLKAVRKDIARILTIMRQRELSELKTVNK